MSRAIKKGIIVTAHRTYKADVLMEGGRICSNLSGDVPGEPSGAISRTLSKGKNFVAPRKAEPTGITATSL